MASSRVMTTAHLSSVPTFGDFDIDDAGHLVDETPRTTFTLVARHQRGKTVAKRTYPMTAYAETDAGSLLVMLGGEQTDAARQFRGIQAFMMRALVDDDGVPLTAVPRLVSDDDLTDHDPDQLEADAEPEPIPADGVLARMGKAALVSMAADHEVDADGLDKGGLIVALADRRDQPDDEQGTDLAVIGDDDPEVIDAKWRLVFADTMTLADDLEFDTLIAAQEHARTHPSSRRLFFDVTGDPEQKVSLDALNQIVGHIAGKAAGRPTKPSAGSSRSRAKRVRRART